MGEPDDNMRPADPNLSINKRGDSARELIEHGRTRAAQLVRVQQWGTRAPQELPHRLGEG